MVPENLTKIYATNADHILLVAGKTINRKVCFYQNAEANGFHEILHCYTNVTMQDIYSSIAVKVMLNTLFILL